MLFTPKIVVRPPSGTTVKFTVELPGGAKAFAKTGQEATALARGYVLGWQAASQPLPPMRESDITYIEPEPVKAESSDHPVYVSAEGIIYHIHWISGPEAGFSPKQLASRLSQNAANQFIRFWNILEPESWVKSERDADVYVVLSDKGYLKLKVIKTAPTGGKYPLFFFGSTYYKVIWTTDFKSQTTMSSDMREAFLKFWEKVAPEDPAGFFRAKDREAGDNYIMTKAVHQRLRLEKING